MKTFILWRTALVVCFLALVLLAGLAFSLRHPETGATFFGSFSTSIVGLAVAACAKSLGEHLAGGGGIAGAAKALFTSAKPETAP